MTKIDHADKHHYQQKLQNGNTGCIKKKFTVGKYSLNERAGKICENVQFA